MSNITRETLIQNTETSIVPATVPEIITPSIHPAFMFIFLIIFWPVGWFLMFRDRYYHRWFAYLLWIWGIVYFCQALYITFSLLPQLIFLSKELNQSNNLLEIYLGIALLFIFSLGEILFGVFIKRKTNQHRGIAKKFLFLAMGTMIVGYIIFVFNLMLIIQPIYNLTAAIK